EALDRDLRARLFPRLALGPGARRLVEFEIAGRQRPEAAARVNRAPAHQDQFAPARHRADDDLRVVVEDKAAVGANHALAVVALGDGAHRRAADRARSLIAAQLSICPAPSAG